MANQEQLFSWEKDISILTNPLILKQLILVSLGAGLFMAFLLSLILALSGDFRGIPPMLLVSLYVSLGFFLFLLLVSLLYFRNHIRVRFTVDSKGALWETVDKRAVTGSRLAMLGGVLGRNPQAAGAGMLAATREKECITWNQLVSVEYTDQHRMITIRNSWRPIMMLVCLPENYEQVKEFVKYIELKKR